MILKPDEVLIMFGVFGSSNSPNQPDKYHHCHGVICHDDKNPGKLSGSMVDAVADAKLEEIVITDDKITFVRRRSPHIGHPFTLKKSMVDGKPVWIGTYETQMVGTHKAWFVLTPAPTIMFNYMGMEEMWKEQFEAMAKA